MRALHSRVFLMAAAVALLLIIAITVGKSIAVGGAEANPRIDKVTVLVFDLQSIASDSEAIGMVESAMGLMFQLKEGQPFIFVFDDEFTDVAGPMATDAEPFPQLLREVERRLSESTDDASNALDLTTTLVGAYDYLNGLSVSDDSSIYIFSGSSAETDGENEIARVSPIVGLLAEKGWKFYDATTPQTSPGVRAALSEISSRTDGESFELSVPDGLWNMTSRILLEEDKGALLRVGETMLTPDAIFETPIEVPPGTGSVNLAMLREKDDTTLRLKDPSGLDATPRNGSAYTNAVVWELIDPAPGEWTLEARGSEGSFSVNRYSDYLYRMELAAPRETVEVGKQITMQVAVVEGDSLVSVNAVVRARITDPSGATVLYDLNDDGVGADSVADDGYFSATIPGVNLSGLYNVELEMVWLGVSQRVTSLTSFEAELFPTLAITEEVDRETFLKPNERARIATLNVGVGGQPFAVSRNDLSSVARTNTGASPGVVEFLPEDQTPDGKASEFGVYYTPQSESLSTVAIGLNVEYAGRDITGGVPPIVLSSVAPPPPLPTPMPRATPAPAPTTPPPPQLPSPTEQLSPLPLLIVGGVVILVVIGLGAYWLTKPAPFGYLYTEEGRMVVRFADIRRSSTAANVLNRDRIPGEDLPTQGFDGVEFRFARDGAAFIEPAQAGRANVRINNQPVTDPSEIHDGSLLGSMGRLYIFRHDPI